ncbi:hypothetical protein HDU67_003895 [Dinochytrium kinnereticum]|nr:hypothetical protein HDU67_003895 [Dinochytrium kinnereticum]
MVAALLDCHPASSSACECVPSCRSADNAPQAAAAAAPETASWAAAAGIANSGRLSHSPPPSLSAATTLASPPSPSPSPSTPRAACSPPVAAAAAAPDVSAILPASDSSLEDASPSLLHLEEPVWTMDDLPSATSAASSSIAAAMADHPFFHHHHELSSFRQEPPRMLKPNAAALGAVMATLPCMNMMDLSLDQDGDDIMRVAVVDSPSFSMNDSSTCMPIFSSSCADQESPRMPSGSGGCDPSPAAYACGPGVVNGMSTSSLGAVFEASSLQNDHSGVETPASISIDCDATEIPPQAPYQPPFTFPRGRGGHRERTGSFIEELHLPMATPCSARTFLTLGQLLPPPSSSATPSSAISHHSLMPNSHSDQAPVSADADMGMDVEAAAAAAAAAYFSHILPYSEEQQTIQEDTANFSSSSLPKSAGRFGFEGAAENHTDAATAAAIAAAGALGLDLAALGLLDHNRTTVEGVAKTIGDFDSSSHQFGDGNVEDGLEASLFSPMYLPPSSDGLMPYDSGVREEGGGDGMMLCDEVGSVEEDLRYLHRRHSFSCASQGLVSLYEVNALAMLPPLGSGRRGANTLI